MKRCTITEYDDTTIVEYYNQETKKRIEIKFNDFDSAIEAIPHLEFEEKVTT
jgi:hypothetical protein